MAEGIQISLKQPFPPRDTEDRDLPPPDPDPNPSSNGRGGSKKFRLECNHYIKVKDAFTADKARQVVADIKFKKNEEVPAMKDRENTVYQILIPFKAIEKKIAHEVIREKLMAKTFIQPFFGNEQKYNRDLMGAVQHFEEKERVTLENSNKEVKFFDKPSPFDVDGIVYFACGDIWRITAPVKKLEPQDILALDFVVEYTGEKIDFELDENKVINEVVRIIKKYTDHQPVEEHHGFFIAYFARALESILYTVLVKIYNQPVTHASSGIKVGCGKTTACVISQLMLTGLEVRGGEFTGPEIAKLVALGQQVFCDELHTTRRDSINSLISLITGQYQGLVRNVGGGGAPKATVTFHCNKPASALKLPPEVAARLWPLYAGETPMDPIPSYHQMLKDAQGLFKYLPNFLSMGIECCYNVIPDDQLEDFVAQVPRNQRNLAQQFWNLQKVHKKLVDLSAEHNVQDIPNCLLRDVDYRPILQVEEVTLKPVGEFLSALNINECWWSPYNEDEGIKMKVRGLRNCAPWVNEWALRKGLDCSTFGSTRFRFLPTKGIQHEVIDILKERDAAQKSKKRKKNAKKGRRKRYDTSSEEDEDEEDEELVTENEFEEEEIVSNTNAFRLADDLAIVKVAAQPGVSKQFECDQFWQLLEEKVPGHKWQDIKNRFFKYIVHNLDRFNGIPSQSIAEMKEAAGLQIDHDIGNTSTEFAEKERQKIQAEGGENIEKEREKEKRIENDLELEANEEGEEAVEKEASERKRTEKDSLKKASQEEKGTEKEALLNASEEKGTEKEDLMNASEEKGTEKEVLKKAAEKEALKKASEEKRMENAALSSEEKGIEKDALKNASDEKMTEKEALKKAAEEKRAEKDALKKAVEEKRTEKEALKKAAEEKRKEKEVLKKAAEEKRKEKEVLKKAAEEKREEKRKEKEAMMKAAEEKRTKKEAMKKLADGNEAFKKAEDDDKVSVEEQKEGGRSKFTKNGAEKMMAEEEVLAEKKTKLKRKNTGKKTNKEPVHAEIEEGVPRAKREKKAKKGIPSEVDGHGGLENQVNCSHCPRSFHTAQGLKIHQRIHFKTNDKGPTSHHIPSYILSPPAMESAEKDKGKNEGQKINKDLEDEEEQGNSQIKSVEGESPEKKEAESKDRREGGEGGGGGEVEGGE